MNMATTSGIPVPCYWPDGQERISLNSLGQHIERQHEVKGFGCDYWSLTDAKEDLVCAHTFEEHGRQGKIRSAANALAHYLEDDSYEESNPELRNTPKKDW